MNEYIKKLNQINEKIDTSNLEDYAIKNSVPIIKEDSLMVMLTLIKAKKVVKILEVGTAIGYSAIKMASISPSIKIDTIERNKEMYDLALSNIKINNLNEQIKVIYGDALEVDLEMLSQEYDLIFIDAAKAQSKNFFNRFIGLLKSDGIVITDNILFHGCVETRDNLTKNVRKMVEKIDDYNHFLSSLNDYKTIFLDTGDGLAITMRK